LKVPRQTREDGSWYRWQDGDLLLSLRIQPRAMADEFVGPEGDHFKVRIAATPAEGKANDHLRRFLARAFGVPQSSVELLAGGRARLKRLRIRAPRKLPASVADP
jgi:uncharacterized protein (TIGR00251 family)